LTFYQEIKPMFDDSYYQLMARYNQWMNAKLYGVCAEIPDRDRKKDAGAFFESIHGTLNHLLFGDLAWMGRFEDRPSKHKIGNEIHSDFDELRVAREKKDLEIIDWANGLSKEWLKTPFTYRSGIDGTTRCIPAWILVTHMFNHQTHHRGQLTTLIKQLGYDPGVSDIPWMPEFEG